MKQWRWAKHILLATAAGGAVLAGAAAQAAETVVLNFGPFSRQVDVEALSTWAEGGRMDPALASLLRRLSPEQQEVVRTSLSRSRPVAVVPLSQWFYDPMGERSLWFLGKFVQTEARLNGYQALRAAIIAAAAETGELSLLEVIRQFPTGTLNLDLRQVQTSLRQINQDTELTRTVLSALRQQSENLIAQQPPIDFAALPDLTQPGPYETTRLSWVMEDPSRDRRYPVELVMPQNLAVVGRSVPVVVISHGLGDRPESFLDIAAQVASHGFLVALPEHIGSNFTQQQALLSGRSRESFRASEFLDRPLDISALLDELERRNPDTFGGRLNVNRVALVGHSFGGYTVLALGGATVDFERLAQRCRPAANLLVDAALALECRALELAEQPEVRQRLGQAGVKDDRVAVVMAFAPVSNLFGPAGVADITVPTMLFGGAFDVLTPVVPQQVATFSWLTTGDRYLYLADNTSHSPGITRLTSDLVNLDQQIEKSLDEALGITRGVNGSLIIAFAQVYGAEQSAYAPFLTPAYVEAASADPFRVRLVNALPPEVTAQLEAWQGDIVANP